MGQSLELDGWDHLCMPKKYGGLVFKKLHEFNLAMLSKQAWRLLSNPDSLVAKLLKARYYPSSSFFNAKLGNNPSYIWRGIIASRSVVIQGARIRIGSGKSVSI